MNKGILIGAGILAGVAIAAGTFAILLNAKARKVYKQVSKETGIPLNEVKAAFKGFNKEIQKMRKDKTSEEQITAATNAFYEELEKKAAN
jgi:hypothetical protein